MLNIYFARDSLEVGRCYSINLCLCSARAYHTHTQHTYSHLYTKDSIHMTQRARVCILVCNEYYQLRKMLAPQSERYNRPARRLTIEIVFR